MKKIVLIAIALFALICLLATATAAQEQSEGMRARSIRMKYDAGRIDGMRIVVYMIQDNNLVAVDPAREFKKGDCIKIEFASSFDGYVYFINIAPSGKSAIIYPDLKAKEMDNVIHARQRYLLPHATPFEFVDDERGIEVVQVVMSRRPLPMFEEAIKNANGELGDTAASAAALMGLESKRSGIATESSANLLPPGVRARSARLAPPKDKSEQGTVIAVPDSKLKPGEVAVFEIRLRHI